MAGRPRIAAVEHDAVGRPVTWTLGRHLKGADPFHSPNKDIVAAGLARCGAHHHHQLFISLLKPVGKRGSVGTCVTSCVNCLGSLTVPIAFVSYVSPEDLWAPQGSAPQQWEDKALPTGTVPEYPTHPLRPGPAVQRLPPDVAARVFVGRQCPRAPAGANNFRRRRGYLRRRRQLPIYCTCSPGLPTGGLYNLKQERQVKCVFASCILMRVLFVLSQPFVGSEPQGFLTARPRTSTGQLRAIRAV